jgi:peptidyl-prolyl cis-trans isomerase SurA
MSLRARLAVAALCLASLAPGAVVERIVAVVGERPILLSEVQRRARPFRARMMAAGATPQQLQQAEGQLQKELLQRMVDERLEELAAEKAKIAVSRDEVDAALANVAQNARMTVADLLREAASQGLPEADYREELRRQLLEGRLYQLRGRGRPRASEAEAVAAFEKWSKQPQNATPLVHVALLPLRVRAEEREADEARVHEVEGRLAAGAEFCDVVREYADDAAARASCGDRGPQPVAALLPAITAATEKLAVGGVSSPVIIGDAVVFVKLLAAPRAPTFADVRELMFERAAQDLADKQRRAWLAELRESHYVDVRM